MLLSFYDWPNVESSTILSTQNTKNKHVQKKSIFKQENYISSNSVIPEDEALSQKINLKDTIDEVPKARRNLNIKLVH